MFVILTQLLDKFNQKIEGVGFEPDISSLAEATTLSTVLGEALSILEDCLKTDFDSSWKKILNFYGQLFWPFGELEKEMRLFLLKVLAAECRRHRIFAKSEPTFRQSQATKI